MSFELMPTSRYSLFGCPIEWIRRMEVNLVLSWCRPSPVPAVMLPTIWTASRPTHSRLLS